MIRRPPRSTRTDHAFPTRLSSDLLIRVSDGAERQLPLAPRPVAEFHDELLGALDALGISVRIHESPNEMPNPIPFREDREHAAYDPEYAQRFWRVLLQVDRVFKQFRTSYRSEEHTSELQSLMRISYAVFCLKKNKNPQYISHTRYALTRHN